MSELCSQSPIEFTGIYPRITQFQYLSEQVVQIIARDDLASFSNYLDLLEPTLGASDWQYIELVLNPSYLQRFPCLSEMIQVLERCDQEQQVSLTNQIIFEVIVCIWQSEAIQIFQHLVCVRELRRCSLSDAFPYHEPSPTFRKQLLDDRSSFRSDDWNWLIALYGDREDGQRAMQLWNERYQDSVNKWARYLGSIVEKLAYHPGQTGSVQIATTLVSLTEWASIDKANVRTTILSICPKPDSNGNRMNPELRSLIEWVLDWHPFGHLQEPVTLSLESSITVFAVWELLAELTRGGPIQVWTISELHSIILATTTNPGNSRMSHFRVRNLYVWSGKSESKLAKKRRTGKEDCDLFLVDQCIPYDYHAGYINHVPIVRSTEIYQIEYEGQSYQTTISIHLEQFLLANKAPKSARSAFPLE